MSPTKPPATRPKQSRALTGRRRRSSAATWTWASAIVVVAIVLVIVLVDTLGSSPSKKQSSNYGPASSIPGLVQEVTNVPASVFDQVGITSPAIGVGGFARIVKQPSLTFTQGSKKLPGFIYYGAEYCPYCAATRWAIVLALSRFGTFQNLQLMKSTANDVDPNTATFSFRFSTYKSNYLVFQPYEVQDRNGKTIPSQAPPTNVAQIIAHYDSGQSFPFLDVGNLVFLVGAPFDPQVLKGESWSQIGSGLNDPTNYATQAIVATANYITAGICELTGNAPALVCNSTGVKAAIAALNKPAG